MSGVFRDPVQLGRNKVFLSVDLVLNHLVRYANYLLNFLLNFDHLTRRPRMFEKMEHVHQSLAHL